MAVSRIEHFLVPYNEGGRWFRLPEEGYPRVPQHSGRAWWISLRADAPPPVTRSTRASAVVLFRNAAAPLIAFESISSHLLRLHSLISSGRY